MPVLFAGHGNPMHAIDDNEWSRGFGDLATTKPSAILAVSAHWYTKGTQTTGNDAPRTIHDFGGFPQALFDVQYPAPGDPVLAKRVATMLAAWNGSVSQDWGLDHGTWSVTRRMHPAADVPIVQLSIDATLPAAEHYAIGKALAPLRDDVLILASGNLVHNLPSAFGKWRSGITETEDWARTFDERVASALQNKDHAALVTALDDDIGALAHPTPDHYLPVLYAAGAGHDLDASFPIEGFDMGDVSMRSVRFG